MSCIARAAVIRAELGRRHPPGRPRSEKRQHSRWKNEMLTEQNAQLRRELEAVEPNCAACAFGRSPNPPREYSPVAWTTLVQ